VVEAKVILEHLKRELEALAVAAVQI